MSDPKPTAGGHHHRRAAVKRVATAVITVSDTRTLETDSGGGRVAALLAEGGHPVVSREIVRDDPQSIAAALEKALGPAQT